MTCQVLIIAPNDSPVKRLVQSLHLSRTRQNISVSGIGEISPTITVQSVAKISPMITNGKIIDVAALVVPRVVRDLPTCPIRHDA